VIDRLPDGASLVDGRIVDASGKPMLRNQVARANGGTRTEEIQKLLSFVPGRGYESYQGGRRTADQGRRVHRHLHALHPERRAAEGSDQAGAISRQARTGRCTPDLSFVQREPYAPQRQKRDDPNSVEGGVNLPNIPPYAEHWKVVSIHTIPEPITLYGLTPHLHFRGRSMKYTLTTPDGREEVLLDVPKYDFNWQLYYELYSPRHIPAGSKVTVVTLFDNSAKNP
jgi:hypothetical protein